MENLLSMNVLDWGENASDEKLSFILGKVLNIGKSASKVSSRQQIHDEIEVISVVEGATHVSYEGRRQSLKYFALVEDIVNTFFHNDQGLAHFLHCVKLLGTNQLYLPNFAISPLANNFYEVKIVSGHLGFFLLSGVFGDLGERVVKTGFLLWVVNFYYVC